MPYSIKAALAGLAALLIALPSLPALAQVNIEKTRPTDPDGFSATLGGTFALRSGNNERYEVGLSARVDYGAGRHYAFLLGAVGYGESDGTAFKDRSFAHARYAYRIAPRLSAEGFAQIENDAFTLLQLRTLVGAGLRVSYVQRARTAVFQGTSLMFEHETLDAARVTRHPDRVDALRWNNYLNARLALSEVVQLAATAYVQPRIDRFEDVRILADATLQVRISSRFSFATTANLRYDSRPPDGIGSTDVEITNGVQFEL